MSQTDNSEQDEAEIEQPIEFWTPNESGYDGYYGFVNNGKYSGKHIVDTETFISARVNPGYDGYQANIGTADSLCGRDVVGRLLPLGLDGSNPDVEGTVKSSICGTCLRILEAREVDQ